MQRLAVPLLCGSDAGHADNLVNANGRLYFTASHYNDAGTYRPRYPLDPETRAISQITGWHDIDNLPYLQGQTFYGPTARPIKGELNDSELPMAPQHPS